MSNLSSQVKDLSFNRPRDVLTNAERRLISRCLHPDQSQDPAQKKRYGEALALFTRVWGKDKDKPRQTP